MSVGLKQKIQDKAITRLELGREMSRFWNTVYKHQNIKQDSEVFTSEKFVKVDDVIALLDETVDRIRKEMNVNTTMLRNDEPKSARRLSVLDARIRMLSWVLQVLEGEKP